MVTGLKDIRACRVGDTMTTIEAVGDEAVRSREVEALPGYRGATDGVCWCVSCRAMNTRSLRDAMDRLKLNDAALVFEPEHSPALGYGFRCGFLGMLHLEILKER